LAGLAMAGQVAMTTPIPGQEAFTPPGHVIDEENEKLAYSISAEEHQEILDKLLSYVNSPAGHLERETELYLEQQLSDILGFEVRAELDGHRLNHSIGIMGSEQHLKRFPSDTLSDHDAYLEAGIAPARGAFGWFTENGQLTQTAIENEKYYFAVQLMYLPEWNENYQDLKPWYKYRKMLVINPAEQVAVVGVIGDAGPAAWVQKQFGGSPEVIREGKIWSPKSKGKVMLLFIDDPEDKVPLGPIDLDFASSLARREGTEQISSNLLELDS
jgi:hypothetical protein